MDRSRIFFTSAVHCFGRFFGKSFGLMNRRTIELSDYRVFGLLGYRTIGHSDTMCLNWWHNYMCIMKWRIHSNKIIKETRKGRVDYFEVSTSWGVFSYLIHFHLQHWFYFIFLPC